MRGDDIHISVDPEHLDSFARSSYGSVKGLAAESGVDYGTLLRAKQNGYVSLETAVRVCEAADKTVTDVFGCQDEGALNRVIFALKRPENAEIWG